jgi:hypothetical protein
MMEVSGFVQIMADPDPDTGGPKHTDPPDPDPDPQHWFLPLAGKNKPHFLSSFLSGGQKWGSLNRKLAN